MAPIIVITGQAMRVHHGVHTPPASLLALLHDCCRYAADEALVLLDGDGAARIGLPRDQPTNGRPVKALVQAKELGGWSGATAIRSPWINLYNDRIRVHLCVVPWVTNDPIIDADDLLGSYQRLVRFWELAGGLYHTNPGVTGIGLLRERYNPVHTSDPMWLPKWDGCTPAGPDYQAERWWSWANPNHASLRGAHMHGYDANRAYLRSAGTLMVARGPLHHRTRKQMFDRRRAGYWRIPYHSWPMESIPDPAGQGRPILTADDGSRSWWVTTPRLRLLTKLEEEGHYPHMPVLESWTAPEMRALRRWSDAVGRVVADPVLELVGKEVYRRTSGMLGAGARRIDRPDWRETWIAESACWTWQKVWDAFLGGERVPVQIEVDAVWYRSDDPDPVTAAPRPFTIDPTGRKLGAFHVLKPAAAVEAA